MGWSWDHLSRKGEDGFQGSVEFWSSKYSNILCRLGLTWEAKIRANKLVTKSSLFFLGVKLVCLHFQQCYCSPIRWHTNGCEIACFIARLGYICEGF